MNQESLKISDQEKLIDKELAEKTNYAGFNERALANIFDQLAFVLLLGIIGYFYYGNVDFFELDSFQFTAGGLFLIYLTFTEAFWGRTWGKKIFHLRVVKLDNSKIYFKESALRNLFRIIDLMPFGVYLVAGVAMFFNKKKQRIGDWVAKTIVVKD